MLLTACETAPTGPNLARVAFADLPGWRDGAPELALDAWRRSCGRLRAMDSATPLGGKFGAGTAGDWLGICADLDRLSGTAGEVRTFVEANFVAYAVRDGEEAEGLFTGYFEPIVRAAEKAVGAYTVPIHGLPRDHVTVRLQDFDPALSGRSLVGRVEGSRLRPYPDRGAIVEGASGDAPVLYWADDALDVFILQVQGSGIVELPDGRRQRIGFAGHNGHDYVSIGRLLIKEGELQTAGWREIRDWMAQNPERASELLARNRRYIFFRNIDGDGAQGAAGVALSAGHSLAVDAGILPLNVPLWLDTLHPGPDGGRLQRLVVAQDVGNAIRGVVRGDLFWGVGPQALESAGRMKSPGAYYLLLPKGVKPAVS